jgi:hypothetical protein
MSRETGKVRFVCCHRTQGSVLSHPSDVMYELQLDAYIQDKNSMHLVVALMNRPSATTHNSYMPFDPKIVVLAIHMTNISHNKQQTPSSCEEGAVGKNQIHHHVCAVQCTTHKKIGADS